MRLKCPYFQKSSQCQGRRNPNPRESRPQSPIDWTFMRLA